MRWVGGLWFDILFPFLNRLSSFGWLSSIDSPLEIAWLAGWGFQGDTNCTFRRGEIESRNHMFFLYCFNSQIWKACLQWCGILSPSTSWNDVIAEGCNHWKTKSLMGTICRLLLSSTIYNIWWVRNEIKFGGHPQMEEQLLKQIFWEVRCRISGKGKFPRNIYGECLPLP
jgi:hypothetical protein